MAIGWSGLLDRHAGVYEDFYSGLSKGELVEHAQYIKMLSYYLLPPLWVVIAYKDAASLHIARILHVRAKGTGQSVG